MKRFVAIILSLALLCTLLPAATLTASAETYSGYCGADLTWEFDTDTGVLTVSGTGELSDRYAWDYVRNQITSVVLEDGVTSIGDQLFSDCQSLTSVTVPGSVTTIGQHAFANCTSLAEITIPDGVTTIGYAAFANCTSLTEITIPGSVTSVGRYFENCTALTEITLLDGVTSIDDNAFEGCHALASVTIPGSVTTIGRFFQNCEALTSVTLLDGVTTIDEFAFANCSSLAEITIPGSVTSIGQQAFRGCTSLTSVTIPDGVTDIPNSAFIECSGLESVILPDSVTSIGDAAFRNCSALTDIYYTGTEEQWNAISVGFDNDSLANANKCYEYVPSCNHDPIEVPELEPTCTEFGHTAGTVCSICGELLTAEEIFPLDHDIIYHDVQEPTCTEDGWWCGYETCSRCDYTTYEEWMVSPALGHDIIYENTQEPTCTEAGKDCYETCSRCDYSSYEEIPALGHDIITDEAVPATCTESGLTAGEHCSRCDYAVAQETVAALGHDYVEHAAQAPTATEIGWNAYVTCSRCEYTTYEELPALGALRIRSAALRLDEDIDVIYTAEAAEGYTDLYMVFTMHGVTYTVNDCTDNGDGTYTFVFTGVTPQCMGDNISATLYASKDGQSYSDTVAEYSVKQYCSNMLTEGSLSTELCTLLSDLLTYGAATQTYTNYNTEALATAGLDLTPSAFAAISGKAASFEGTADANIDWTSATLVLRNALAVRLTFCAASTDGLTVTASINGREQTFAASDFVAAGDGKYYVDFRGIKAAEFDDAVTASFAVNGVATGRTISYAANAYICGMQDVSNANLRALVRALYNYGVSAAAYSAD